MPINPLGLGGSLSSVQFILRGGIGWIDLLIGKLWDSGVGRTLPYLGSLNL